VRISTTVGDEDATVLHSKIILDTKKPHLNSIEQEVTDAHIDMKHSSQNDDAHRYTPMAAHEIPEKSEQTPMIVDEISEKPQQPPITVDEISEKPEQKKEPEVEVSHDERKSVMHENNNQDNIHDEKPIIEEDKVCEVESQISQEPQVQADVPSEISEPMVASEICTNETSQPDLKVDEIISVKSDQSIEEVPVEVIEQVEGPKEKIIEISESTAAEENKPDEIDSMKQDKSDEQTIIEDNIEPESIPSVRDALPVKEDIKPIRLDSIDNAVTLMENIPDDERVAILEELISVSNDGNEVEQNLTSENLIAEKNLEEVQNGKDIITEIPTQDAEIIA